MAPRSSPRLTKSKRDSKGDRKLDDVRRVTNVIVIMMSLSRFPVKSELDLIFWNVWPSMVQMLALTGRAWFGCKGAK